MKPFFNGWMWTVLIVAALVCGMFVFANLHPYTLRFEMDDNTLEAVKTIDWDALDPKEEKAGYNTYTGEVRGCLAAEARAVCGDRELYGVWQEIMSNRTPPKSGSYICDAGDHLDSYEFNETVLKICGWWNNDDE